MSAPDRAALAAPSGYRPDIDGLRAIAVVGVVLFHAGLSALPGGFVGVDVFFVISGYLITRQVVGGVRASNFSFAEFYVRRVRRLLPAALTTTALTLLFAVLVLSPVRVVEIGRSAAAAAVSVSNIYFWRESGYWSEASASQPLLHTWSLSVEEQFYLVWPLLIFVLLKWFKKGVVPILIGGAVLSLVITTIVTPASPDAAFYLTPFRVYEFAIGALCVWVEPRLVSARPALRRARTASWVVGVGAILGSMLLFHEEDIVFPGWLAVIPALGTALVILAARPAGLDRALANPVMTYLGLRSYSLYLVHWPVLVYASELAGGLNLGLAIGCVAATVVLAELQYRFVERPLRIRGHRAPEPSRRAVARRFVFTAGPAMAVAVALCAGGLTASWFAARPQAYAAEVRPLVEMNRDAWMKDRRIDTRAVCATKTDALCGTIDDTVPDVLVLGDSMGPEGVTLVRALAPDVNLVTGERAGCPPLVGLEVNDSIDAGCVAYNDARLAAVAEHAASWDLIVLSMRLTDENAPVIAETVEWLADLDVEVAVLGVSAHYERAAWQTIAESGDDRVDSPALHDSLDIDTRLNERMRAMVEDAGAVYLDRWDWICGEDTCRAFLGDDVRDLVMFDTAHMTRAGTLALAEELADDPAVRGLISGVVGD